MSLSGYSSAVLHAIIKVWSVYPAFEQRANAFPGLCILPAFSVLSLPLPPLCSSQVLDGPHDELRRDAMDALCTMAVVLGQDFNMFVPTIRKVGAGSTFHL